jgi:VCBS repeat-containing protein
MGKFNRIFNRARLRRERKVNRKASSKTSFPCHSKFILEPFEPRLLLSGDFAPHPAVNLPQDQSQTAIVLFQLGPNSQARDNAGNIEAVPTTPDAQIHVIGPQDAPLIVTSFTPTASGFIAHFNRPVDSTVLSLYDTETEGFGTADVTLVGSISGAVRGSLVLNGTDDEITFIKTGGPLLPDAYTVTLRSASNGFKDTAGGLLDGNNNGTTGDNYIRSFTVAPNTAVVVSVADFTRGPGQSVHLPPSGVGIPVTFSNGAGVQSVDVTLKYNPALLTITSVISGTSLPTGSQIQADLTTPGESHITLTSVTALGSGAAELVRLLGQVPANAPYGAAEIIGIANVTVNGGAIAAIADDGLHVAAYFGDATGNGSYSSLDGQRVLRVAAGLDTGFAPFIKLDPVVITDITGNAAISSLDGTRILQEVVGLNRPEIPPLLATNTAPVANNDAYTMNEDAVLSLSAPGFLSNDTDVNGDALSAWLSVGPTHGTLTLNSNGSFTYSPVGDFNGSDSFTCRVTDGAADSNVAMVAITVNPVNDAPILAAIGNKTVEEGALLTFTASATDVDGDALTFSLLSPPAGATTNPTTGIFNWTPTRTQGPGTYNITVHVTDGVLSDDKSFQITVNDVAASGHLMFNVSFDDPQGTFSAFYPAITSEIIAAGLDWDDFILGNASLEVIVRFNPNIPTETGGSITSNFVGTHGAFNVFEQGAAAEIRTGVDPNAATPDIQITIGTAYLTNELWFDPDPLRRTVPMPTNKTDAVSVFIHELGHAFAFNGFLDPSNGAHSGNFESTYDENVVFDGNNLFFIGPHAEAVYGGPVPLTFGNYAHVGNQSPRPGSDLLSDLMNGVFYLRGTRYDVSSLDFAILQDVGVPVSIPPGFAGVAALPQVTPGINISSESTTMLLFNASHLTVTLSEVPFLTNVNTPSAMNSVPTDNDNRSFLDSNIIDDELSEKLTKSTGKDWLFFTCLANIKHSSAAS